MTKIQRVLSYLGVAAGAAALAIWQEGVGNFLRWLPGAGGDAATRAWEVRGVSVPVFLVGVAAGFAAAWFGRNRRESMRAIRPSYYATVQRRPGEPYPYLLSLSVELLGSRRAGVHGDLEFRAYVRMEPSHWEAEMRPEKFMLRRDRGDARFNVEVNLSQQAFDRIAENVDANHPPMVTLSNVIIRTNRGYVRGETDRPFFLYAEWPPPRERLPEGI